MFYALSDSFTGDNPREITHGFANRKVVIAFNGKAERAQWLDSTRLQTARPLSYAEALARTDWQDARFVLAGEYGKVKAVRIHGMQDEDGNDVYHVMAEKD